MTSKNWLKTNEQLALLTKLRGSLGEALRVEAELITILREVEARAEKTNSHADYYGDMIIERDATIKAKIDEYRLLNDEYRRVVTAKQDLQRQLDEQINTIKVQYGDIRRLQDEKQKYNDLCMSQHAEIERLKDKLHVVKTNAQALKDESDIQRLRDEKAGYDAVCKKVGIPQAWVSCDASIFDGPMPTPMLLYCPECQRRHIDEGEFATKVHHTHSCQSCGFTWRPAVIATVGVRFLPGFKNDKA